MLSNQKLHLRTKNRWGPAQGYHRKTIKVIYVIRVKYTPVPGMADGIVMGYMFVSQK